ncbi:MAG: redoxin domain-containing protein [Planctomycetia bacterium]|nr:redoxin domain-containing protein [Planctomycetia bacterium]
MRIAMRGLATGLCCCLLFSAALAKQKDGESRRPGPESPRREGTPKAGDVAPDFTLATLDGKQQVRLSDFRGKRPVALVFGSYT